MAINCWLNILIVKLSSTPSLLEELKLGQSGLRYFVQAPKIKRRTAAKSKSRDAFQRLAKEGCLDEWAETSIQWAKDTFGADNVVGAHLHMDEKTPHLHVTVVPIVTTEGKRKAREQNAKKRYRTKSKNGPRLSADDVMTRENLTRFQDTYAEAMKRFGLERGVRGSEARHVDQHEYYRQCQIEKKGLEEDVARLTTEKKKLVSYYADKAQEFMNKKHEAQSGTFDDLELLNKFYPEVMAMLPAIRECQEVKIPDRITQALIDKKPRVFNPGAKIYDPAQQEAVDVSNERVEFKRDPTDNKFHLHLGGLRIFEWLKQKWQSLRQTIRSGFKMKH